MTMPDSAATLPQFDDGKAPGALRTIGEVGRALGLRPHILRYWEEQFPALRPIKRSGGRRYYRTEDVALIAEIDRLVHREGYTLRGARLALTATRPPKAPPTRRDPVVPVPESAAIEELRAIREDLAEALARS